MMKFFIHCIPPKTTAQANMRIMKRKDGSQFVGKFASSKGKKTQDELMILLRENCPSAPLEGPLRVSFDWVYPWRKSETKKNKALGYMPCTTRPDCSNLVKMIEDCMTRLGYWGDDSQIADLRFKKGWGDECGIGIEIKDIGNEIHTSRQ